ncbi:DUF742 domain-containing protein [Actinokineospora pegani]|uniref:DUF742 domain-containing protein n=1 Tax=Actinokineospora pegani TaxID=2654637 RepID=UPI0012EA8789|nr:DUF742 domain-containing protein [Actinokineospora pegani]
MRSTRVRPYAITRGRTRPRHLLLVETLVSVPHYDPQASSQLMPETQALYERARQRTSVAELSAHLDIPLGVIRVLLSDLAAQEMVFIHPTGFEYEYDAHLLERILDGLKGV